MTPNRRMLLVEQPIDGPPAITPWGTAVLFGTTLAELGQWVDLHGEQFEHDDMPDWLVEHGRRRGWEAHLAVRSPSMTAVLTYWAVRDFGEAGIAFDMVVSADVHQLWMIATQEVAQRITGEAES